MVSTDRIADMWTDASDDYDRIVSRELRNPRDVYYWRHELDTRLGDEPRDVLDVGCGPGFFSIMLSRLGHRVTSLDASEGMLRAARRNLTWYGIEPHVQHSDVVTLDGVADSSVTPWSRVTSCGPSTIRRPRIDAGSRCCAPAAWSSSTTATTALIAPG